MSVEVNISGPRVTKFSTPGDTNYATIYTCLGAQATLIGIVISPLGTANATIAINDGSTDHVLLNARGMTSGNSENWSFANIGLKNGWSIKVKSSVASTITFAAIIAEETGRTT